MTRVRDPPLSRYGIFLQQQRPIATVRRLRRAPGRALSSRQFQDLAAARIEPVCAVATRLQLDGRLAAAWQVDSVLPARLGQAESAFVDELVMRLGLPPFKAGEEV